MTGLERRYRWLLRAYPSWYRRDCGEDMLGTLLDREPGGGWPAPSEALALVTGGLRVRSSLNRRLSMTAGLRLAALFGLALAATVRAGHLLGVDLVFVLHPLAARCGLAVKRAMDTLPAPGGDIWGEDDNPRRYDAYAREYPGYRQTSRDLIALALPSAESGAADAAVLDLACGTGVTTREILPVLGPHSQVTGVDQSAAMLEVAARSTTDPRATWVQARAENVDQHMTGPVDAVICNSAIWQTNVAATAIAVRAVLQTRGRFAFNVPAGFLDDGATHRSRDRYPALFSEMRAIAARDYGWAPDNRAPGRTRQRLTRESIRGSLSAAGFDVEQVTEVSYQASTESERAWLSIPIFTRDQLSGLPYEQRMRVLGKACEHLGPSQTQPQQWVVFIARATDRR